jgi:phosphoglycerate dehydrogenase-like enzyme
MTILDHRSLAATRPAAGLRTAWGTDTASRQDAGRVLICEPIAAEAVERMRAGGLQVDERVGLSPEALAALIGDILRLEELLPRADFVSVHIPPSEEGRAEIGGGEIARMKDGVLQVNCARGGVVDEDALLDALDSGKVRGAALDVFAEEPPTDPRLASHPRVVCTPHLGASTREAQARIGMEIAQILLERL